MAAEFDSVGSSVNNIVNAQISSGAGITDDKLATLTTASKVNLSALFATSQATGDVIYASSNSAFSRLAKGTSGQFLKIGASIPAWTTIFNGLDTSTLIIKAISFVPGSTTVNLSIGGTHTVAVNGTGDHTITWGAAFSNANYIICSMAKHITTNQDPVCTFDSKGTSSVRIYSGYGAFSLANPGEITVFAIGT